MPELASGKVLKLLRIQHELLKRTWEEIERGDFELALPLGKELSRNMPGVAQAVSAALTQAPQEGCFREETSRIIMEMRKLQEQAREKIETEREELARVLLNLRSGRRLIRGYRSCKTRKHRLFDING